MEQFLACILIGIILSVIGGINLKGNISTLHSYHRKRVSEENRLPFARLVGLGTILCGCGVTVFGVLNFVALQMHSSALTLVGTVVLIVSLVLGIGLNFYAMIKYNGGIF